MLSIVLLAVSLQMQPSPPVAVELIAGYRATAAKELRVSRGDRAGLVITVNAPAVESDVEELSIRAENQHADYWKDRPGPNLFVTTQRLEADGTRQPVATKLFSSGSGKNLTRHTCRIDLELRESSDVRKARMRSFLQKNAATLGAAEIEGAITYFERIYVANPPGTYEIEVTYAPQSGMFAGKTLGRRLMLIVEDGPDPIEQMK